MSKLTDVHIFSPGVQISAQGVERNFTKDDLQQVVNSYNPNLHESPVRIGHEDSDKVPAWGWVKGVKLKGEDLYAEVEFTPQMGGFIRDGLYKKVSASFYAPESKINPEPGQWSLRHVAVLGGQPPAVKGLTGFAYSEADGVLDFAAGVEIKLSPDQVFDEELGPTLKVDQSPLEFLKDQLEEARQEMAKEEQRKAEMDQELEAAGMSDEITEERPDSDFAEEEKVMKKKPSKAKQGAEDADEEEEGKDAVDNGELPPALKEAIEKKKKKSSDEEEDTSDNKEKMDPVGQADGDVDNDGDEDSSDEYLKKRRAAIKKSIKGDTSDNKEGCSKSKKRNYVEEEEDDTSDNQEYETDEGEGPVAGKVKKNAKSGASSLDHSEITVPEGADAAQFEAGFKDAMDKFYTAVQIGSDEVVHQEADDQTEDYLAGIEAGFEFAQARLNRIGSDGIGSASHDDKCCSEDEEAEGQGPVASKIKKQKTGANETDAETGNNFQEATFEPGKKKRGHDNDKSSDVGVKADSDYEEDEDQHGEGNDDFKRDETGKTKSSDASNRKKKGVAGKGTGPMMRDRDYDKKGVDGGAHEKGRTSKGTGKAEDLSATGKSEDVQKERGTNYVSVGGKEGSGKAIKAPSVRVLRFAEQQQADFSELTNRLAELEAANAKLVQEKVAAERKAHRMQLNDFAESLYTTGRLTNAMIDQDELVDYMEGLENGTLEFAEGESAATPLMNLLAALPSQVEFSEVAGYDEDAVPDENLDPHERALRLVKESGVDYAEALKQTLFTVE
jgi:hypothetical protein